MRKVFLRKKPSCGALRCIKLITPIQRLMRHKALHNATLRKKLHQLYAGSDAARDCGKKNFLNDFLDRWFSVENRIIIIIIINIIIISIIILEVGPHFSNVPFFPNSALL